MLKAGVHQSPGLGVRRLTLMASTAEQQQVRKLIATAVAPPV
jgi:hypothetical protein